MILLNLSLQLLDTIPFNHKFFLRICFFFDYTKFVFLVKWIYSLFMLIFYFQIKNFSN